MHVWFGPVLNHFFRMKGFSFFRMAVSIIRRAVAACEYTRSAQTSKHQRSPSSRRLHLFRLVFHPPQTEGRPLIIVINLPDLEILPPQIDHFYGEPPDFIPQGEFIFAGTELKVEGDRRGPVVVK